MIAKLIVWDRDRPAALARMRDALAAFEIVGPATNVGFLGRLVSSRAFAEGDLDTGLIERSHEELFPAEGPAPDEVLALATAAELLRLGGEARAHAAGSGDPWSPWSECDGWRLNQDNHHVFVFRESEQLRAVTVHYRPGGRFEIELPGGRRTLACERSGGTAVRAWLDDEALLATVVRGDTTIDVFWRGERHALELHDPWLAEVEADAHGGGLAAPMPGKVIAVLVETGAKVERGAPLLIMEAMKMEHTIMAPAAGSVREILYGVGDQVAEGAELIRFDAAA
jgi:3-methylcrotonyl-CoA carboxylase alpha subunit